METSEKTFSLKGSPFMNELQKVYAEYQQNHSTVEKSEKLSKDQIDSIVQQGSFHVIRHDSGECKVFTIPVTMDLSKKHRMLLPKPEKYVIYGGMITLCEITKREKLPNMVENLVNFENRMGELLKESCKHVVMLKKGELSFNFLPEPLKRRLNDCMLSENCVFIGW